MSSADYCGVSQIALGRAAMQHAIEAGQAIPDHDATLDNINDRLDECADESGFAMSDALWNEYANKAVILPFYAPNKP